MVQYLPLQKHRQNNGWTQTLDMTHNKPCCERPLQLLVYQNGNICFTVLLYSSSGSIKLYQNRCFDVFRFRCYFSTLSSVYTYQFQQIAMDLCLPLFNFPKKPPSPLRHKSTQKHHDHGRTQGHGLQEQRGSYPPATSYLQPSHSPHWCINSTVTKVTLYHEEGHQFGWEYIIWWKQKTTYQKLDEITREVLISSSRLCSIADNTNKVTQLCANKQTLLHSISKFPFQDMCVFVVCFSCISVTGDPNVVLSVKSPPMGQRYGQWSGSWQLYATKNGGEAEFRKRGFIENIWKHVSTSPFLHIKRLVLDLGSSSFPSTLPIGFHDLFTILLLMLNPSQPQYIRSKSYSLLHCWPSTTLGHEMTPRGLRKSSPILLIGIHPINPTTLRLLGGKGGIHPPSFSHQETEPTIPGSLHPQKWSFYLPSSLRSQPLPWVFQICQESEASHKRFPFYTRVENHGPVQRLVFKMLSTATVLNDTWPCQTSNKKPSSLLNLCCCENRSLLGVFVRK